MLTNKCIYNFSNKTNKADKCLSGLFVTFMNFF